jgi:formylglycine-generating enzyme required for sulfatase activity
MTKPTSELSSTQEFSFETVLLNPYGEVVQKLPGKVDQVIEELPNDIPLELVVIPKGFFQMGSRHEIGAYEDELPLHAVFLESYALGKFPITQAQWQAVMGGLPNCRFHGPDRPVDNISWAEANGFCERLSKITSRSYTLPSEAQWEYACRAGTITNGKARTRGAPQRGEIASHVARGGSWHETPGHCRSAVRLQVAENERLEYYGLRVMLIQPLISGYAHPKTPPD